MEGVNTEGGAGDSDTASTGSIATDTETDAEQSSLNSTMHSNDNATMDGLNNGDEGEGQRDIPGAAGVLQEPDTTFLSSDAWYTPHPPPPHTHTHTRIRTHTQTYTYTHSHTQV
jgi:hypothetical protein